MTITEMIYFKQLSTYESTCERIGFEDRDD